MEILCAELYIVADIRIAYLYNQLRALPTTERSGNLSGGCFDLQRKQLIIQWSNRSKFGRGTEVKSVSLVYFKAKYAYHCRHLIDAAKNTPVNLVL